MKNIRKSMKANIIMSVIVVSAAMFAGAGCKSKKSLPSAQADSVEVEIPLSGPAYRSNADYFRASQSGRSPDLATARRIADMNARTALATLIESTMKVVTENYTNQATVGDRQEFMGKFEEQARSVVNQTLNDVTVIGERTFREPNGSFTHYVALQMSKDALLQNLNNSISRDELLRLEFNQHRFREVFDAEMKKFESGR